MVPPVGAAHMNDRKATMNAGLAGGSISNLGRGVILASLVLLSGCIQPGGGSFTPFATLSKEKPLAEEVNQLVVTTSVGDVVISPSPGEDVKIEAVVHVRGDRVNVGNA